MLKKPPASLPTAAGPSWPARPRVPACRRCFRREQPGCLCAVERQFRHRSGIILPPPAGDTSCGSQSATTMGVREEKTKSGIERTSSGARHPGLSDEALATEAAAANYFLRPVSAQRMICARLFRSRQWRTSPLGRVFGPRVPIRALDVVLPAVLAFDRALALTGV